MIKISRKQARERYIHHESFIMVPGNYRPDSWAACQIDGEDCSEERSFENLCDAFVYYNASISRKICFYVA